MKDDHIHIPAAFAGDEKFAAEWRKMQSGEVYDATYEPFIELLKATRRKIRCYNTTEPEETQSLTEQLREILGSSGERININQPFRCDYGCNIHVGEDFFANFNFTVLDEAPVVIGNNVFVGPNVSIYTACHPLDPAERRAGIEWAEPVVIGDDVWIGGSTTILPGVTIGAGTTIGAGSVVTKDIPGGCVAVGNPCRVIRRL